MRVFLFGKHPAVGDFLSHGLDSAPCARLENWLQDVLSSLKTDVGAAWETTWDSAPLLNFWIGPDIIGVPLIGVFVPSRDKVGRRFPLIMGLTGMVTPPPLHPAHDPAPFIALAAHVAGICTSGDGTPGVEKLIDGFDAPPLQGIAFEEGQDGTIWAHREDGDLDRLFMDAISVDADKAQLGRSHWWHAAASDRHAGWLGTNGMPDTTGMKWLLTERAGARGKTDDD